MKYIFLVIIMFYQSLLAIKRTILVSVFGFHSVCKHRPSCSQYTLESIEKDGTITGLYRGIVRVLTCF